jgi:hypothetical protein
VWDIYIAALELGFTDVMDMIMDYWHETWEHRGQPTTTSHQAVNNLITDEYVILEKIRTKLTRADVSYSML